MDYIISEAVKEEDIRLIRESNAQSVSLDVLFYDLLGIQYAEAACPTTTTPTFVQHMIDIDGGSYGGQSFNGGNDLYNVEDLHGKISCKSTYILSFYDEDHPYFDHLYDGIRLAQYGRIHDVEYFTIYNNNVIKFNSNNGGTWSNTNKYNCLEWGAGCHDATTKPYYGANVYVSNTWNHMMDTSNTNTNPSLTTAVIYY